MKNEDVPPDCYMVNEVFHNAVAYTLGWHVTLTVTATEPVEIRGYDKEGNQNENGRAGKKSE